MTMFHVKHCHLYCHSLCFIPLLIGHDEQSDMREKNASVSEIVDEVETVTGIEYEIARKIVVLLGAATENEQDAWKYE